MQSPAHVVVRVVSGDLEHLAHTLRQHLPLLGLRPHHTILRRRLRPSITSMLHKNIFQLVSHVALASQALRITVKMNRSILSLCLCQTSCSNTLRTASFGARTTRHLRVVRQAPSSKEWLPSVHGGKDVDEDAGDPLPNSRNLRKCRSRRRMHALTSLLSKRCRRTNAGCTGGRSRRSRWPFCPTGLTASPQEVTKVRRQACEDVARMFARTASACHVVIVVAPCRCAASATCYTS